jgi:hypothetical protein
MNCSICEESFNKSTRKKVECYGCKFAPCSACAKYYILNSTEEPHCMSCKIPWFKEFIRKEISASFLNKEYKAWRIEMLFSQEMAMMPASQLELEDRAVERKFEKMLDRNRFLIDIHQAKYSDVVRRINTARRHGEPVDLLEEELTNISPAILESVGREPSRERKKFIKKCTFPECMGYLSEKWKCGLCGHGTCRECLEIKTDNHECDPDTVSTAVLLKSDTKQCPKCNEGIYRIHGCDVMFCTLCNTTFNWKTGNIMTVRAHNPHYIEWLQSKGITEREPGDIPCGLEVDGYMIAQRNNSIYLIRNMNGPPSQKPMQMTVSGRDRVQKIVVVPGASLSDLLNARPNLLSGMRIPDYETIGHVTDIIIPRLIIPDNRLNRMKYLEKEITVEEFKKRIIRTEQRAEIVMRKLNTARMFIIAATDIFHREMEILTNIMEHAGYNEELLGSLDRLYSEYRVLVETCAEDIPYFRNIE